MRYHHQVSARDFDITAKPCPFCGNNYPQFTWDDRGFCWIKCERLPHDFFRDGCPARGRTFGPFQFGEKGVLEPNSIYMRTVWTRRAFRAWNEAGATGGAAAKRARAYSSAASVWRNIDTGGMQLCAVDKPHFTGIHRNDFFYIEGAGFVPSYLCEIINNGETLIVPLRLAWNTGRPIDLAKTTLTSSSAAENAEGTKTPESLPKTPENSGEDGAK